MSDVMSQESHKYNLRRVYLNQGGYTSEGYYYGHGCPLYEYISDHDSGTIRAYSRKEAKEYIRKYIDPKARFFN